MQLSAVCRLYSIRSQDPKSARAKDPEKIALVAPDIHTAGGTVERGFQRRFRKLRVLSVYRVHFFPMYAGTRRELPLLGRAYEVAPLRCIHSQHVREG